MIGGSVKEKRLKRKQTRTKMKMSRIGGRYRRGCPEVIGGSVKEKRLKRKQTRTKMRRDPGGNVSLR